MTPSEHDGYAPSGSIRIVTDSDEEEFRRMRDEICDDFAKAEGTRIPGQLGRIEYALAIVAVIAAFIGILLCR